MKELTVAIQDEYEGKVIYRTKLYTEEEYKELENELEYVRTIKNSAEETLKEVREENRKLNKFKTKREESMFYFKALAERAEPKTAREAEDLQRAKEIFEKLYREELHYLEEENKKLNERIRFLEQCLDNKEKVNKSLREELEILELTAKDYAKLCGVKLDDN